MSGSHIEVPHSLIEYAQELQGELSLEPIERKIPLMVEAIHLLESAGIETYTEDSGLLIDARLSFWKPRKQAEYIQQVFNFGTVALEGYGPYFSMLHIANSGLRPINCISLALSKICIIEGGKTPDEEGEMLIPVMAVEQVLQFA